MKTIRLPFKAKRVMLACGADLKGAFAVAIGDKAYLEDGFGDLGQIDNLAAYEKAVKTLLRKLRTRPKIVACDMHPGYFSAAFAKNFARTAGARLHKIQHHEAHIASVIADNSIRGDVIGVAFDGTGLGADGRIWGGEFFAGRPGRFRRAAHLEYVAMPGGEAAVHQPWRMATSYLYKAYGAPAIKQARDRGRALFIKTMIDEGINSPLTSSAGRLFDAAASLILKKDEASSEAELPIALEKIAVIGCEESYDFDIRSNKGIMIVCVDKIIKGVMRDLSKGIDRRLISARFHNAVAGIIEDVVAKISKKKALSDVVLSGGVYQNHYILEKVIRKVTDRGLNIFIHRQTSTTDSGIPLGQLAIAQTSP